MKYGLAYASPALYNWMLWGLYRARPRDRFASVAHEVARHDVVIDLCAGTSLLYDQLTRFQAQYVAFDINPRFVRALRKRGIEAYCCDVGRMDIPEGDVVTMMSALYHFHPECEALIERMKRSARKKVIVVEPVRNNASSAVPLWGAFARWVGKVDGQEVRHHFGVESLSRLLEGVPGPQRRELVCGGRDLKVVWELESAATAAGPRGTVRAGEIPWTPSASPPETCDGER